MPFVVTQAALDRCKQTIHAAELFHGNAPAIARACAEASSDEVVVAAVDRADILFAGSWIIRREEITRRVPGLVQDGWTLLFSPQTVVDEIRERALQTARLAFRRWEAMQRWNARR